MKNFLRRLLPAVLLGASLSVSFAATSDYPNHPITVVLPFGAGGSADRMLRIMAPKLEKELGQPIVLDAKAGAGTNIGTEYVAHSHPDGYTLLVTGVPLAVNPSLYKKISWKQSDFAPVGLLSVSPYLLVVNPALPANTFPELLAYAKSHPDQVNFGSPGAGSGAHLAGALINQMAGTRLTHVAYKGGPQAMTDVIGGQTQLTFSTPVSSAPMVNVGRLRALAVTGSTRLPSMPSVPTVAESLPGYEMLSWYGLLAPSATPPEIVDKLNKSFAKVLKDPEVIKALAKDDMELTPGTPADFTAFLQRTSKTAAKLVEASGATID